MQAFLLAAGLGTRLRPLTLSRPKALVEVKGRTLLETNIQRLAETGARRIVVNVHHFAQMMRDYVASRPWPAEVLVSDESHLLLDTGGALRHAAPLFLPDEPILTYNVDVLSSFSLREMLLRHARSHALATLAVSRRDTSRLLLFRGGQLVGWRNRQNGAELWCGPRQDAVETEERAFSGIAVVSPSLLALLPPATAPYPIIPEYIRLAQSHRIQPFEHPAAEWVDVGKPDALRALNSQ